MSKHDQAKIEKRLRNEEYAKKHKKKRSARVKGRGANWCRIAGHPQSCDCVYEVASVG